MGDARIGNYFSPRCRLCLSEEGSLMPIFKDESGKSELADNIYLSVKVEIKEVDLLSTMICSDCVNKLNSWTEYKKFCCKNQEKLLEWTNAWKAEQLSQVSIQIKNEIIIDDDDDDDEKEPPAIVIDDDEDFIRVKAEPEDNLADSQEETMDVEYDDLPPPLTPQPLIEDTVTPDGSERLGVSIEPHTMSEPPNLGLAKCSVCDRAFSNVANRNRHEITVHGATKYVQLQENRPSASSSSTCVQNFDPKPTTVLHCRPTTDAPLPAGLQLQRVVSTHQQKDNSNESGTPPTTPTEISYMRKCKDMAKMLETLVCACHNKRYETQQRLYTHLRRLHTWFPGFTCFRCATTCTNRSTYMSHYKNCGKPHLHNLYLLAKITKNTSTKIRVYHSFRCTWCKFLFRFYEDFCKHICLRHVDGFAPHSCYCGKIFEHTDAYKKHLSQSCFVQQYCDICLEAFTSLEIFEAHCEKQHDNSEGFVVAAGDSYPQGKRKRKRVRHSSEDLEESPPKLTPALLQFEPQTKKINLHAIRRYSTRPTACTICGKVYSNYNNMLRHFTVHSESQNALSCGFCVKKFRLVRELKEHEKTEHNGLINQTAFVLNPARVLRQTRKTCPECGERFSTQLELNDHQKAHLNIKVYRDSKTGDYKSNMISAMLVCESCDKSFETKADLHKHQDLHEIMPVLPAADIVVEPKTEPSKYNCVECNKNYSKYNGLWQHNKNHHPNRRISREYSRKCKVCNKILRSGQAWYMHNKMHQGLSKQEIPKAKLAERQEYELYFSCRRCSQVFSSVLNLNDHMKSHEKDPKTFSCELCHQLCQSLVESQRHKREHSQENLEKIADEDCNIAQRNMHNFACDICPKLFSVKLALKTHKMSHSSAEDKRNYIYCKYCKIPFKGVKHLEEHMIVGHGKTTQHVQVNPNPMEEIYPCSICNKVFDTSNELVVHHAWHKRFKVDKRVHMQEMAPARAAICNLDLEPQVSYDKQSYLHKNIERKAVEVKSFQCNFCSTGFSRNDMLNAHMREFHRAFLQDNFTCHLCNRVFENPNALTIHLKVHERERLLGKAP